MTVLRGPNPTRKMLTDLKRAGVKTILNLQTHDDVEELICCQDLGLALYNLDVHTFTPRNSDIHAALYFLNNELLWPIYVHCRHGRERTGLIFALYRIQKMGWTPDEAYEEMVRFGCRWPLTWIYRRMLK